MDQIVFEVDQLIKEKTLEIKDENEIRKYFNQLRLSNEISKILESMEPQQINQDLVYVPIQIIDVLDSDVFVGAIKNKNYVTLYPIGCQNNVEGQVMYFDKLTFSACLLEQNYLYKPTKQIVTLESNFIDQIKPQIFNKFNVLAIKHQIEDSIFLNVIKFIQPKQQQKQNKLEQYQNLISTFNSVVDDKFVSEMIALHLLSSSKFETYNDGGRQILNLYGLDKQCAEKIAQLIQKIYSPSLYIPLDQQILKDIDTLSAKNYDENYIKQGLLCVPTNIQSQIIVDETVLQEGQISGKTLQNLSNIQKFIQHSKIGIDFQYSIVEIPVQTNVMILSFGKSFIENADQIKVKPKTTQMQEQIQYEGLEDFINTIHQEQQLIDIDDQLKKQINGRFIELRQQSHLKIDVGNLNNWILWMKILSSIKGEEANYENFNYAVQLDLQRIERNL